MKILLTTLNAKFIHSSLALAYLNAYCQADFNDLHIREYTINEPQSKIMADIYSLKPDVVCFSCYIWNIDLIKDICSNLKQVLPDIKIIVGGPEVTYDAPTLLQENQAVDYVIRGEGEETLYELLYCLQQEVIPQQVSGLTYRHDLITANNDRPLINHLDKIPFPYEEENIGNYNNRVIYYETSRGCPFNCSYCLSSTTRGVRYFSLERVFKDLKFLIDHQVPEVKFVDRTFNCNEKRSIEIMSFIMQNNIKTKFHFEIDATLLTNEFLAFLRIVPSGVFDFEIGVQSTYPKALCSVNRNSDWIKLRENISYLLLNCKIHIHLDLIAGLPYEDFERFKISFNDVYNLKPHVIQLGFLKLLKGSLIRTESNDHNYKFEQKPPYQVLENDYISYEDMLKLVQVEDLVSRYYNTGIVSNCLSYIIDQIYMSNAFAFWQDYADFLNDRNFFRFGHRREEEYTFLCDFIARYPENRIILEELIKLDYFLNNQSNNLPAAFSRNNPDKINEILYSFLKDEDFIALNMPVLINKTPRERRRIVHMEYLLLDVNFSAAKEPVPFIFIYDSTSKRAASVVIARFI